MTSIRTENYEIEIADNRWRLFNFYSLSPDFELLRGDGVMRYTSQYGETHGLPGTQLTTDYVRAVVVGFDTRSQTWRLGLHVAEHPGQKPTWIELTHWPQGKSHDTASDAQRAGRVLAEYLNQPLKLFGVRKPPQEHKTGPLQGHERRDISLRRVQALAPQFKLPLEYPGMWLGRSPNGVMLRLAKNMTGEQGGKEAPPYQTCEVEKSRQAVKMLPPTGLLGAFFSTPGRQVSFEDVRNIEFRYTVVETSEVEEDEDSDLLTELTSRHHAWEVLLTVEGESLLLARTQHTTSGELERMRTTSMTADKRDTNFDIAVDYYRMHEEDQRQQEEARRFAQALALHLAADVGVKLVETAIGAELPPPL